MLLSLQAALYRAKLREIWVASTIKTTQIRMRCILVNEIRGFGMPLGRMRRWSRLLPRGGGSSRMDIIGCIVTRCETLTKVTNSRMQQQLQFRRLHRIMPLWVRRTSSKPQPRGRGVKSASESPKPRVKWGHFLRIGRVPGICRVRVPFTRKTTSLCRWMKRAILRPPKKSMFYRCRRCLIPRQQKWRPAIAARTLWKLLTGRPHVSMTTRLATRWSVRSIRKQYLRRKICSSKNLILKKQICWLIAKLIKIKIKTPLSPTEK